MRLCPVCQKKPSNTSKIYGAMPCDSCQKRRSAQHGPAVQIEFTSESIKTERRSYAKSIIQPYRSGELSREYLDTFGTKGINPSQEEIKKARNVWSEDYGSNFDVTSSR